MGAMLSFCAKLTLVVGAGLFVLVMTMATVAPGGLPARAAPAIEYPYGMAYNPYTPLTPFDYPYLQRPINDLLVVAKTPFCFEKYWHERYICWSHQSPAQIYAAADKLLEQQGWIAYTRIDQSPMTWYYYAYLRLYQASALEATHIPGSQHYGGGRVLSIELRVSRWPVGFAGHFISVELSR